MVVQAFRGMVARVALSFGVVAGLAVAASAPAAALPAFTFNPAAVGLTAPAFTADNLLLSDYSTVTFTGPNGSGGVFFTDNGVLPVSGFSLGSTILGASGIDTTFGLYFQFTGTGSQNTAGFGAGTVGTFNTLDFTLYGYKVTGTVTYAPSATTPAGVTSPIALATGHLFSGGVGSTQVTPGVYVPNANTLLSFIPSSTFGAFFQSPTPFYNADFAAFTNNPSQVAFNGTNGFVITQGGGSANFLTVPEPATFALLAVGIVGLGFARSKRRASATA